MAELQNFRSAFNGFNREDVVHYIEYINNKHSAQIAQLKAEMQSLQEELTFLRSAPQPEPAEPSRELEAAAEKCGALEDELAQARKELEETNAKCAQLAEELAQARQAAEQVPVPAPADTASDELEAYRRAERTERLSQERAAQLCARVNGILADTTAQVDDAAAQLAGVAEQAAAQVQELQAAILSSKSALRDAAAALYAIQPAAPGE